MITNNEPDPLFDRYRRASTEYQVIHAERLKLRLAETERPETNRASDEADIALDSAVSELHAARRAYLS